MSLVKYMVKVEPGGVLGKTFGKTHQRVLFGTYVRSSSARWYCTYFGFEQFLNTSKSRGLTYAVFRVKRISGG